MGPYGVSKTQNVMQILIYKNWAKTYAKSKQIYVIGSFHNLLPQECFYRHNVFWQIRIFYEIRNNAFLPEIVIITELWDHLEANQGIISQEYFQLNIIFCKINIFHVIWICMCPVYTVLISEIRGPSGGQMITIMTFYPKNLFLADQHLPYDLDVGCRD